MIRVRAMNFTHRELVNYGYFIFVFSLVIFMFISIESNIYKTGDMLGTMKA